MKKINKETGFSILAVILVIVAVIMAIGIWALSGQNNATSSSNSSDVQATSIINDGAAIKLEFDNLVIKGSNPDSIVYLPGTASTATAPNIFDPINGMQYPKVNKKSIRDGATEPDGIWVFRPLESPAEVGSSAIVPAILLAGIKDKVCQRINFNLYGSINIPTRSGAFLSSAYVTGATSNNPNSTSVSVLFSGSGSTPANSWTNGCIKANTTTTSIDNNIYFRLLMVK